MPALPLFDLHCDTLYECLLKKRHLTKNDLHLSLERLSEYEKFCQILAVWSDAKSDEERVWNRFFEARALLSEELEHASARLCLSSADLAACERDGVGGLFLAVEGGKLLGDHIERLDILHASGVRFLTLVWDSVCKLGGAHDTHIGLSDFGREVVKRCHRLGIIPDVSHASDAMIDEVFDICREDGGVCIATHSNARAIRSHSRNLTDERFSKIAALGGVVGISLAPIHLSDGDCSIRDVVRHIEHYMSLGGEDVVCLGADLDGVPNLPNGIENASDLYKIADSLGQIGYTDECIKKIFYANARNFISLWLN